MYKLENGTMGTAAEKVAELSRFLAEARAGESSETRWAFQYKTERDKAREQITRLTGDDNGNGWLILFHGSDSKEAEWEWVDGDRELAVKRATCDSRHTNYGRSGCTIVRCADEPEREDFNG